MMGVMGGYLGGGREYLEGGGVGVDSSVWVPPFWEDPHLADAHLHDPSIAEAAHMGEPPTMGDVGGADLMDAFPPHPQHGMHSLSPNLTPQPIFLPHILFYFNTTAHPLLVIQFSSSFPSSPFASPPFMILSLPTTHLHSNHYD